MRPEETIETLEPPEGLWRRVGCGLCMFRAWDDVQLGRDLRLTERFGEVDGLTGRDDLILRAMHESDGGGVTVDAC
ncbi:MAG: hypothetical protein O3A51_12715 [Verrucomicrobia bacterium]|nr:hypothetical protein [Verrucomicrobiota bacterium]